jgi:hypothetical protein
LCSPLALLAPVKTVSPARFRRTTDARMARRLRRDLAPSDLEVKAIPTTNRGLPSRPTQLIRPPAPELAPGEEAA